MEIVLAGTKEQKARGAFFTPPAITRYLADWAIERASDRILEPSCGESAFLLAAGNRLQSFGAMPAHLGDSLHGVELHSSTATEARRILAHRGFASSIEAGDFFDYKTTRKFDAVLGNPPFVRYQDFSGVARARSLEASLAQGVRLSGLSSSWAAFGCLRRATSDERRPYGAGTSSRTDERRLCLRRPFVSSEPFLLD